MSTSDDAILPSGVDGDDALRDAVGVKPRRARRPADDRLADRFDDGDGGEPPARTRSRRTMVVASVSIIAGLSVAALVFLGRANADRYLLVCASARVTAEQGRAFPPWGSRPMIGPEWKPIALPADAECKPHETEDVNELGKWYLDLLIDRATITLTARNLLDSVATASGGPQTNPLDAAAEQLDQALLLARDPDRRDQRKEIQRLHGDVDYWRASARLRDASAVLLDAAKQFDTAAAQRPRHVSDAAVWATFLRKLADELHQGPGGAPAPQVPAAAGSGAPAVTAPPGVALPVEPDRNASGSAAPPAAPDAGVPAGGVLL